MDTINLKFSEVIEGMAKERGLTVSDVKGELSFSNDNIISLHIQFFVEGGDYFEEIEACDELYIEKEIASILEKYKIAKEGFKVTRSMYQDIARKHVICGEVYDDVIDGVSISVVFEKRNTKMETYTDTKSNCLTVENDFDADEYFEIYEQVRDKKEADDRSSRYTYEQLDRYLRKAC